MISDPIKENINKLALIDEKRAKELDIAYDKFSERVRKERVTAENAKKKDPTYVLKQSIKALDGCTDALQKHGGKVALSAFKLAWQLEDLKVNIENLIEQSKQNLGGFENGK